MAAEIERRVVTNYRRRHSVTPRWLGGGAELYAGRWAARAPVAAGSSSLLLLGAFDTHTLYGGGMMTQRPRRTRR
jgi:hypothetical protein